MNGKQKEVEELKKDVEVRRALEQAGAAKEPKQKTPVERKQKIYLGTYILLVLGFASLYYVIRRGVFVTPERFTPLLQRLSLGLAAIALVLAIASIVRAYLIEPLDNTVARYNLNRVT